MHVDWCVRGSKCVADAQASRAVLGRPDVFFFYVPDFVSILVEEDATIYILWCLYYITFMLTFIKKTEKKTRRKLKK